MRIIYLILSGWLSLSNIWNAEIFKIQFIQILGQNFEKFIFHLFAVNIPVQKWLSPMGGGCIAYIGGPHIGALFGPC